MAELLMTQPIFCPFRAYKLLVLRVGGADYSKFGKNIGQSIIGKGESSQRIFMFQICCFILKPERCKGEYGRKRRPSFALFDPYKNYDRVGGRSESASSIKLRTKFPLYF